MCLLAHAKGKKIWSSEMWIDNAFSFDLNLHHCEQHPVCWAALGNGQQWSVLGSALPQYAGFTTTQTRVNLALSLYNQTDSFIFYCFFEQAENCSSNPCLRAVNNFVMARQLRVMHFKIAQYLSCLELWRVRTMFWFRISWSPLCTATQ